MTEQVKSSPNKFKKYVIWFWAIVASGIFSVVLIFVLTSNGAFGELPTFKSIENPDRNYATEIISADGKILGTYFKENRTPVTFKELPENIVEALVATEDERYYEHSGIDAYGTVRAITKFGKGGGASTISQQLAKGLFTKKRSLSTIGRIKQKLKEWVIAVRLERQYTKNEIITMYLNNYDFNNLAVGINSASRIYFGKEPKDLNVEESAMFVGMLKNSTLFNPTKERRKDTVLHRRNVVLKQMAKANYITEKEKDSLQKLPLGLNLQREDHSDGYATYFREHLRAFMKDWTANNLKEDGEEYDIYKDGLKIYVTIDSRMQKHAEEAMEQHMANLQKSFFKEQKRNKNAPFYGMSKKKVDKYLLKKIRYTGRWERMKKNGKTKEEIIASFNTERPMKVFSWNGVKDTVMTPLDSVRYYKHFLRAGLMSTEPQTGHIKAWVGGINYKYFKFDNVKSKGGRQVGSTFKPFVYASAINQLQYSPCKEFTNVPYTIPKEKYGMADDWTPKNSDGKYGNILTLKEALAGSVNTITARLIDEVGPETVVRLANDLGISKEIQPNPSIALGAVELNLYDMVGAYSTLANKGLRIDQMIVTRIEDKNGTVLEDFMPKTHEILSEESSYVVLDLLKGVTESGSGIRLRTKYGKYPDNVVTGYPYEFKNPIAGKTGTTQNQSDGWFMGVVPNLTTGVWVGGDEYSIHFRGIARGQGASMALPIWALYHKALYADPELNISQEDFEKPEELSIEIDCGKKDDVEEVEEDSYEEEDDDILNDN
ncbi:transglycosylase domain-containing protein [Aureivirga sp. CE67]|uniref:transglycosylase domain-containing protein n=1 Tax=Aureivirga sp. CE67 TaxID=1788983 RepID=UPI0018CA7ABE|nr:transglycosylase domain-containing protein [Aureivirga sp. CE67]